MVSAISFHIQADEIKKEKGSLVLRAWHLHIAVQRFCFFKFTKPVDERDLQVPPYPARAINAALTSR